MRNKSFTELAQGISIKTILIACTICVVLAMYWTKRSYAAPGAGIKAMINTPASAFDVYLARLYVQINGINYFGGPNIKEPFRAFRLEYDYPSNTIHIDCHIMLEHKLMQGFNTKDVEGKKAQLIAAAKEMSKSLGLEPMNEVVGRSGVIQSTPIRYGWSTNDFDDEKAKNEIADRTEFRLIYASEATVYYQVTRTPSGLYQFALDTKTRR